jgi:methyl-accepting chemotaxis protein
VALGALAIICLVVAVGGMFAARANASRSRSDFVAFQVDQRAYEGWISEDDQTNGALAAASLQASGGELSGLSAPDTWVQLASRDWRRVAGSYHRTLAGLDWLATRAPTAALRLEAVYTRRALGAYRVAIGDARRQALAGRGARAALLVSAEGANASNIVRDDFVRMGMLLSRHDAQIALAARRGVSQSLLAVLAIGLSALMFAIVFTLLAVRSITRPLRRITLAADRLADGDVEVAIDVDSSDEIGQVASAFRRLINYRMDMAAAARQIAAGNLTVAFEPRSERDDLGLAFAEMRAKIADLLREISTSSRTVGSASAQIARSGQQTGLAVGEIAHAVGSVAQGAEVQVRALAHAREVTDEVASASQLSAAEAQETAAAARETRAAAEEGTAAVKRATEVMRAVQASSAEITRTIHELGSRSHQIGGIVDTITAVTEQTNLLALNAAIEAARAGEQGRGFAVVAEHVRELAEQSRRAAATIGELIAQIQTETGTAVQVVLEGARQTEEGVTTVEQAREAFLRIDASVVDMNGRVERIASSLEQIASSGARMQESVDEVLAVAEQSSASAQQVSATAENTSATTQEIAASAEALAGTAGELERLVGLFTLV